MPRAKKKLADVAKRTTWRVRFMKWREESAAWIEWIKKAHWLWITIIVPSGLFIWYVFFGTRTSIINIKPFADGIEAQASVWGPPLTQAFARDYSLSFPKLPIEDTPRILFDERNDVVIKTRREAKMLWLSGDPVPLLLRVGGLRGQCRQPPDEDTPDRYTRDEIWPRIATGRVQLVVHVRESNNRVREVTLEVPAADLEPFIRSNLPQHTPQRSCK